MEGDAKANTVECCSPPPPTSKTEEHSGYDEQHSAPDAASYYHVLGWQSAMQYLYHYPPPCDYWALGWSGGQHRWRPSKCHDSGPSRALAKVNGDRGDLQIKAKGSFTGHVWPMACDAVGCRALQEVFDQGSGETQAALARELEHHVWEAIQCKNANHVIQKCIVTMSPDVSQFIINEIMLERHGPWHVVRHCFGCRVVERLLEHCSKSQVQVMVDEILQDAAGLCKHLYGNYVAQHLLEHGAPQHQHLLAKVVQDHVLSMCTDYHAVAVVSQALCSGAIEDRVSVARSVLDQPGLVLCMARSRHGQEAVKRLLEVPSVEVCEEVWKLLAENIEKLRGSRYGRVLVKHLFSQHGHPCGSVTLDDESPVGIEGSKEDCVIHSDIT